MSVFGRIIERLHRVFSKDPEKIPVIKIDYHGSKCSISVQDMRLTSKATDPLDIDISMITLSELVTAINSVPGYVAALASPEYGNLLARGLFEDSDQVIT